MNPTGPRWTPCLRGAFYVYVIELNGPLWHRVRPDRPIVYVGQSCQPPAVRLQQHLAGYKASRYVKKYGVRLRPRLYARFNPMSTRTESLAAEREVARRLRNRGYTVYGGT